MQQLIRSPALLEVLVVHAASSRRKDASEVQGLVSLKLFESLEDQLSVLCTDLAHLVQEVAVNLPTCQELREIENVSIRVALVKFVAFKVTILLLVLLHHVQKAELCALRP